MTTALQITSSRMVLAGGFDTDNKYLRKVSNSANRVFYNAGGQSILLSTAILGSASDLYMVWKWQIGPASFEGRDATAKSSTWASSLPTPTGFATPLDVGL